MTDSLWARLAVALAPQYDKRFRPEGGPPFTDRDFAIKRESERLAPLLAALVECVEALEFYQASSRIPMEETVAAYNSGGTVFGAYQEYTKRAREALAKLEAALATDKRGDAE